MRRKRTLPKRWWFERTVKNRGKDFTSPWVWISSNHLTSLRTGKKLENSVFDIGGGRPKVGPVALKRKLLSAFWYEGQCYEFAVKNAGCEYGEFDSEG